MVVANNNLGKDVLRHSGVLALLLQLLKSTAATASRGRVAWDAQEAEDPPIVGTPFAPSLLSTGATTCYGESSILFNKEDNGEQLMGAGTGVVVSGSRGGRSPAPCSSRYRRNQAHGAQQGAAPALDAQPTPYQRLTATLLLRAALCPKTHAFFSLSAGSEEAVVLGGQESACGAPVAECGNAAQCVAESAGIASTDKAAAAPAELSAMEAGSDAAVAVPAPDASTQLHTLSPVSSNGAVSLVCSCVLLPVLSDLPAPAPGGPRRLCPLREAAALLKALLCDSADNQRAVAAAGAVPVLVDVSSVCLKG